MLKKIAQLSFVLLLVSLFSHSSILAQRNVNYRTLVLQNQQQNIYISHFTLPGDNEGTIKFITTFRMNYQFLPFKKANSGTNGEQQFVSSAGLSMEVFQAKEKIKKDNFDDIEIEGLESAGRAFWKDTAYAATYEQTKSNDIFIEGYMEVELKPGLYNYMMQLERGAENSERPTRKRQVQINPYSGKKNGSIVLGEAVTQNNNTTTVNLLNYGNNARYGKDYYALVQLPNYSKEHSYSVSVTKIDASSKDTTQLDDMFTKDLGSNQILENLKPAISTSGGKTSLILNKVNDGDTYALIKVPNSQFPNALYRLKANSDAQEQPVSQAVVRSFWPEIPTSLLNLETAIEMTKFIISDSEYEKLRSGSKKEKEQKFREFWDSKDPTPKTEYNELMTEYYNRVDYAFENFSTTEFPGFETDQGQIYIKYGKPDNIERKFPTDGPTIEVWTYGSKKFVFRATTGFGDFELVSK